MIREMSEIQMLRKNNRFGWWAIAAVTYFLTATPHATADETLYAIKDSFLTQSSRNTNEGGNHVLRLRALGNNRAIVAFDLSSVDLTGLTKATLVLTIRMPRRTGVPAEPSGLTVSSSPSPRATAGTWAAVFEVRGQE